MLSSHFISWNSKKAGVMYSEPSPSITSRGFSIRLKLILKTNLSWKIAVQFLCHTNAANEMILKAKNMQAKTSCNEYLIQRKFEMAHSAGFPKYGVFEIITRQGRLFPHFKSRVKNRDANLLLYIVVRFCSTYFF